MHFNNDYYRAEINGLRAIAVLSVIAHHLKISGVENGFLGVNVFFVISGYVIFKKIIRETRAGAFTPLAFIKSRINRLLPALLVMILATSITAIFLLPPFELKELSDSAFKASISLSNFYFADNAKNYFGSLSSSMPLLHTWSLSIEEQFYLVVSLLLLFRAKPFVLIVIMTVISLLGFVMTNSLSSYESFHFYNSSLRFWEFSLGGLLALNAIDLKNHSFPRWMASVLILLLFIQLTLGLTDAESSVYIKFFLTDILTALVLITLKDVPSVAKDILNTSFLSFTGKISYSLYLWHWPIIVFVTTVALIGTMEKIILIFVIYIVAFGSYELIEKRFRQNKISIKFPMTLLLVTCTFSVVTYLMDGFPQRLDNQAREIHINNDKKRRALESKIDGCEMSYLPKSLKSIDKIRGCSTAANEDDIEFILWGDSHAGMFSKSLFEVNAIHGRKGIYISLPGCPSFVGVHSSSNKNTSECIEIGTSLVSYVNQRKKPIAIYLASRWANFGSNFDAPGDGRSPQKLITDDGNHEWDFKSALKMTVEKLQNGNNVSVKIIGPTPEIDFNVPSTLIKSMMLDSDYPDVEISDFYNRQSVVLSALSEIQNYKNLKVLYPHEVLCDKNTCMTHIDNNPLYVDDDHLSLYGARFVADKLFY